MRKILLIAGSWVGYDQIKSSLECAGYWPEMMRIDFMPADPVILPNWFGWADAIVYFAINGGPCMPSAEWIANLGKQRPTAVLVPEASDDVWWRELCETWSRIPDFPLVVNIDGNRNWTGADKWLTTLTPTDWRPFSAAPEKIWKHRAIRLGFPGASNQGIRVEVINSLDDILIWRGNDPGPAPYQAFADFVMECKFLLNIPNQGAASGNHVKGRVIEAGLGNCCLIEYGDSPIAEWFDPWLDYIPAKDCDEVRRILDDIADDEAMQIASNLSKKVRELHSPAVFWETVFGKIG